MARRGNYIEAWLKRGWVKKEMTKYGLTETGRGNLELVG